MIEVFKRHGVNFLWTIGIFLVAFLFYIATSAFMPYPGISSEYFTALCFPGHAETLLTSPVDSLFFTILLKCIAPGHIDLVFSLICAAIGAGIVMCIFRCAIATARVASSDLTGIHDNELDRTLFALSHISFETGLGAAFISLTTLPIWAMATRLYPQALTTLIMLLALTFAMEFRWRVQQSHVLDIPPKVQHGLAILGAYALASFILFSTPTLAPIIMLVLFLASTIFFNPMAKGRGLYLITAGLGLLFGLLASIGVTAGSITLRNFANVPLPNAITLWGQTLAANLAALVPTFTSFEGLAPLVLFLLAAALYLGCFPQAYLRFGSPLFGQITCLALCVVTLLRWPTQVWELFEEPSASSVAALFMVVLCLSAIFGSWLNSFYGTRAHWSRGRIRTTSFVAMLLLVGSYALTQGVINAPAASGLPLRQAMQESAPLLDTLLPKQARIWLTPNLDTLGIIARRYTEGKPVHPLSENLASITPEALQAHPVLREIIGYDPLVHHLAGVGAEPLRQYLLVADADLGIIRRLPSQETAHTAAQIAKQFSCTDFGQTTIGRRSILWLNQLAAREHAACAISAEPEAAATHLRLARTLDPENPGIPLSLAALADKGITVTLDEQNAARDILEAKPFLRAPSETEALNFEYVHGPICTKGFCSASRLRRFHLGNAPAVLQDILQLYRTSPDQLSRTEKLIAVLYLPTEEVAELLKDRDPEAGDMELFFCLNPNHPKTAELYEKYHAYFQKNDALNTLFRDKETRMRSRIPDKMLAFFLRDGTFAYALFYVNALLEKNDIETASKFVGGFNVRERLRKTPALIEELCCRVLDHLKKSDPAAARTLCEGWLRSEPRQYRLWTQILNLEASSTFNTEAEIITCLRYYPLHPTATARHAELLEQTLGADIARQYREAVKKSTETDACLQRDSHAHRRF
jgi:hypothetical protein